MKKNNIFLALLTAAFVMTSCMDGNWDNKVNKEYKIWNDTITEHNIITIKQLKTLYATTVQNNKYKQIAEDYQVRGIVVANDDGGNLTQQIVIREADETDASAANYYLVIGVTMDAVYNYILPGQEVLVSLKDLYIGGYGSNAQIGYPSKNASGVMRIGRLTEPSFWKAIKLVGSADKTKIDTLDYATIKNADKDRYAGAIVKVTGTIHPKSVERWYLAPAADGDTGNGVTDTIYVNGSSSDKLMLRTSTYADFANYAIIKNLQYTLYGVITRYNSDWQLGLRTMSDITENN